MLAEPLNLLLDQFSKQLTLWASGSGERQLQLPYPRDVLADLCPALNRMEELRELHWKAGDVRRLQREGDQETGAFGAR